MTVQQLFRLMWYSLVAFIAVQAAVVIGGVALIRYLVS